MENLKHAQPHSSKGHQDKQGDHQEANAPPFPVVPWFCPPVGYWWWKRSNGRCRGAGSTGVSTAVHPKDLGVHVVQVLLHSRERDGLDVLSMIFHMAAKNCWGCPRLSPGGRPSSAFMCLHHSSSEHPAQMLQLYESLKHQQQTPKSFRPRLQVWGTRLLLPHRGGTHRQRDQPGGRLHSHKTALGGRAREAGALSSEVLVGHTRAALPFGGLSNQPSTHPPTSHPFQQPPRAEAAAFPLQCPRSQAEQKE